MPREELPVRIDGGHAACVRPVALLLELREALAGPRGELAVGMLLDESPVGLARVGGFGRAPVLLLPAAACHQGREHDDQGDSSGAECDHDRHPWASDGPYYDPAAPREHRMIQTLKRRLIDQIGDSPTFVSEGSRLTGDLETSGPLVMCGAVRGDGRVAGALRMSATAEWHGEIHAQAAVVAGKISGKLVVEDKLEVGATAVLHADVVARRIAVAKGAIIDGAVTVTSGEPVVEFEEKRAAR
ncbi:MAG: polymer-forming cytoskeletal protein [Gammaproteobacteria bacterium]|nr:MAG: polymer-forming cytoskeletal protein [Gammaproteobacteria bacterium]